MKSLSLPIRPVNYLAFPLARLVEPSPLLIMKHKGLIVPGTLWPPPVTQNLLAPSNFVPTFLLERHPTNGPPPGSVPQEWQSERKFLLSTRRPPAPLFLATPRPVLVSNLAVRPCRILQSPLISGRHRLNTRLLFPGTGLETTNGAWVLLTSMELILLMTVQPRRCRIRLSGPAVTPLCRQLKLNLPPALKATLVTHVPWCLLEPG